MVNNDEKYIDNVPHEPQVNVLEVGGSGQVIFYWSKESCKNQHGSDGAHEPVTEIGDIDEEGDIGEEP